MTTLCEDRYFTKIDLAEGYWQIPVEEESKPMTSFSTHKRIIPAPDDVVWSRHLRGNLEQDDEKTPQRL